MPTSSRNRRRSASVGRQLLSFITAAFIILQPALFDARQAAAQRVTRTRITQTSSFDQSGPPNDTGTGSISLTTLDAAIPTETFNTLSNTAGSTTNTALPTGWYITEGGGGARDNEQYAVDTGGSTTGDTYSYGSAGSTDRALGELRSGTLIPLFGAKFTNNTGATITSLDVSYTGEQWRFGGVHSTVADRLDFQYSLNATDLSTGTYLDANALDFNPPITAGTAGALDGNNAANRTAISSTITGLSIPAGATFFIRFNDVDATGADDGLAVDDFSVTPHGGIATPTPTPTPSLSIGDVSQAEGDAGTTNFNFNVSLSSPAQTGGVSFTVNTADGTATAPSDYTAIVNGTGSIAEGNNSTTVTVQVNGDTTIEPNETFFVNISNVTGAGVTDSQGQGTITNDDVTLTKIHDIQGNGTTSPVAGQSVTTRGIVTAIKTGSGFFIQEPDATVDADPNTSEGVFVFTGSSIPAAAVVGNLVQVAGTVQEFIPAADPNQHPSTEIAGSPTVSVLSTGNTLPTPITITAADTLVNNLDNLERYEGMRVTVPSLTVVAPTQGTITEPSATASSNGVFYGVVTGVPRPFREPGVNISDPLPAGAPANVPRFDENPERIRIDSDAQPGTTPANLTTGNVLTNVTGPLDYQFRTYTILPDTTVTGTDAGATPVPTPRADEFTVASFNMERFFDNVADGGESGAPTLTTTAFNNRLNKASLVIRNVQHYPDVIGVEEMENLSTLQQVAAKVNNDAQTIDGLSNPNYQAFLVEGNDVGGIDVGFLVKTTSQTDGSPRVSVVDVTQVGKTTTFTNPDNSTALLNDRPPLVLRATIPRPAALGGGTVPFTVIVNHLRSLSGVDDTTAGSNGWPTEGDRVRAKRRAQAEFLANLIQSRQSADPTEKIITVGDMNAFRVNDGYVDVIGTVLGTPAPADQVVLASPDLVNPDQTDLVDTLPADQQYSYSFDGNAQTLDHVIVNPPARAILDRFAYARDDADQPQFDYGDSTIPDRISDHDQPVAYFSLGSPQPAGSVIISEFRFRGPGGGGGAPPVGPAGRVGLSLTPLAKSKGISVGVSAAASAQDADEFVEFYNNTDSNITVSTTDGSPGWALVAADSQVRFIIPAGTVIPARGHFLAANTGYSLSLYAAPDTVLLPDGVTSVSAYELDIPDGSGIALFQTSNPSNFTLSERLDAAGYASVDPLYREGAGFPAGGGETTSDLEYSFLRTMTRETAGLPKDTGDNLSDFIIVNTAGASTGMGRTLGAPGPEDLSSPLQRNGQFGAALLDPSQSSSQSPNRVRDLSDNSDPNTKTFGTMTIRRTFTNNTGSDVTTLRFRIVEITTFPSPGAGTADLRALDIGDTTILVNGNPVFVNGTTVDSPMQTSGGGLNTSMRVVNVTLDAPIADGDSVSVQFRLGVVQTGNFRFFVNIEATTSGSTSLPAKHAGPM